MPPTVRPKVAHELLAVLGVRTILPPVADVMFQPTSRSVYGRRVPVFALTDLAFLICLQARQPSKVVRRPSHLVAFVVKSQ
jgi:hypothetical protein